MNIRSSTNSRPGRPNYNAADPHYGTPPTGYRAPSNTHVGAVKLAVTDLDRAIRFYTGMLGFHYRTLPNGNAALHVAGTHAPLIVLQQIDGTPRATPRSHLGLYHFALLLPDRLALGRVLKQLLDNGLHPGASDHDVSEALYLSDPDGLGIEIYADRPRELWRAGPSGPDGRAEIHMTTVPLDAAGLIREAGNAAWDGMPTGTRMGHIHLHVGSLAEAEHFYADGLGLDRMVTGYPGALFLAAGGYHHHVGLNTWAGRGAQSPSEDQPRLLEWTLVVPTEEDVQAITTNLATNLATVGSGAAEIAAGTVGTADSARIAGTGTTTGTDANAKAGADAKPGTGALISDPWGTAVRVQREGAQVAVAPDPVSTNAQHDSSASHNTNSAGAQ